ncbi:Septin spn4 [Coemansia sp. D1744]|nr:Septin spn4 [Coemansia sp. D1744]
MSASDANSSTKSQASTGGIGIANLPNQLHKIVTKKGTNFSLMVVGESGTGKTTFINTLLTTELIEPLDDANRRKKQLDKTVDINIHKAGKYPGLDLCSRVKLRSLLIRTHMLDLISTTEEIHYDKYRITQMKTRKFGEPKLKKADNKKFREEEDSLRSRFTEKVKLEENRFRQWEQRLIAERDRLNKDLEQEHNLVKQLESEIEAIANSGSPNGKFFRK